MCDWWMEWSAIECVYAAIIVVFILVFLIQIWRWGHVEAVLVAVSLVSNRRRRTSVWWCPCQPWVKGKSSERSVSLVSHVIGDIMVTYYRAAQSLSLIFFLNSAIFGTLLPVFGANFSSDDKGRLFFDTARLVLIFAFSPQFHTRLVVSWMHRRNFSLCVEHMKCAKLSVVVRLSEQQRTDKICLLLAENFSNHSGVAWRPTRPNNFTTELISADFGSSFGGCVSEKKNWKLLCAGRFFSLISIRSATEITSVVDKRVLHSTTPRWTS